MEDLKKMLVNLSISDLHKCILEVQKEDKLKKDIGPKNYSKVQNELRNENKVSVLRDFHNWIKSTMITNIVNLVRNESESEITLLDIAVGRGGDISKWNKAGINYVYAFDYSEDSIYEKSEGAIARLKNLKPKTEIKFAVGDATFPLGDKRFNKPNVLAGIEKELKRKKMKGFNIVSCQFALHYFFRDSNSLENVLMLVSKVLVPGGYFMGTTIDSAKFIEYYSKFPLENRNTLNRPLYRIHKTFNKKTIAKFGNEYEFTIKDEPDTNLYFNVSGTSKEYLVNFKTLTELASKYSLEPYKVNIFDQDSTGNPYYVQQGTNITNFESIYSLDLWKPKPNSREITEEELELSFLNSVFIFKKK